MFKSIVKKGAFLAAGLMIMSTATTSFADGIIKGNLRVVIGSKSTGGDTYQNSVIVANALAKKLGINVKVDATGASTAFKAIDRAGVRGNTIMIFHDQAFLGYLYGKKGYFDVFSKYIIGPAIAINPGNAYLVPKNSPYETVEDIINACGNGEKVRVAIQPGGVSEIGYTAIKNAISLKYPGQEKNFVAVNTGSQSMKNQLLFDGQADLINGSVQANEQYTRLDKADQKAMKFVWLTAREETIKQAPEAGLGETSRAQLLKFVDPSAKVPFDKTTNFTFDKEFFFLYNKKLDPKFIAEIDNALTEIFAEGEIQKTQKKSFFIPDFMPSKESAVYFEKKMQRYKKIINSMK